MPVHCMVVFPTFFEYGHCSFMCGWVYFLFPGCFTAGKFFGNHVSSVCLLWVSSDGLAGVISPGPCLCFRFLHVSSLPVIWLCAGAEAVAGRAEAVGAVAVAVAVAVGTVADGVTLTAVTSTGPEKK